MIACRRRIYRFRRIVKLNRCESITLLQRRGLFATLLGGIPRSVSPRGPTQRQPSILCCDWCLDWNGVRPNWAALSRLSRAHAVHTFRDRGGVSHRSRESPFGGPCGRADCPWQNSGAGCRGSTGWATSRDSRTPRRRYGGGRDRRIDSSPGIGRRHYHCSLVDLRVQWGTAALAQTRKRRGERLPTDKRPIAGSSFVPS